MLTRFHTDWSALPFSSRLAVAAWAVLLAAVAGRVAVSGPHSQTVLPIYLTAGQRWAGSEDLYDRPAGSDVYRNPPGVAAVFAPLTRIPPTAAGLLWRGIGAGVFLLGLWRFRRDAVPELSAERAGWMFALSAVLALSSLNNGQVNLLLAGAGLNGTAAAARGRWWQAAGWFAFAGWLKVYPLAVGLLTVVVAPRPLGPRLLAATALGFALPFAWQDPGYVLAQYRSFLTHVGGDDRTYAALVRVPVDWTVVPRVWAGWVVPPGAKAAVSLAAAAAAAVGLVYRRPSPVLALVLGSVWMTAFGPATEVNTYSVLAGVAAYLAVAPGPRGVWRAAVGGYGLLAASVVRCAFPEDWTFQVLGPQAAGAVLLGAAALLADRRRAGRPFVWGGRVALRWRSRMSARPGNETAAGKPAAR